MEPPEPFWKCVYPSPRQVMRTSTSVPGVLLVCLVPPLCQMALVRIRVAPTGLENGFAHRNQFSTPDRLRAEAGDGTHANATVLQLHRGSSLYIRARPADFDITIMALPLLRPGMLAKQTHPQRCHSSISIPN